MKPRITLAAPVMLFVALLLTGCASQVPLLIRQGPADSPTPAEVRGHVDAYTGRTVRWGGKLLATENRAQSTRLTILARPLTGDGEPALGDASLGRFITIVPDFLDPKVYTTGRLVTVTGSVRGGETDRVGEHAYVYPLVEAQAWYLWPEPEVPYGYPYPWWYDPWYGPWWYGGWYDPWYSPWYYQRWYPYSHPHRHKPERPATPPGTDPWPPRPDHPPTAPHKARPRQDSDGTPPPAHLGSPQADRPVQRRPESRTPRVRTDKEKSRPREKPEADSTGTHEHRTVPAPERMEPPAPAPASPPAAAPEDRNRGVLRNLFRRGRDE